MARGGWRGKIVRRFGDEGGWGEEGVIVEGVGIVAKGGWG